MHSKDTLPRSLHDLVEHKQKLLHVDEDGNNDEVSNAEASSSKEDSG